jgi:hypothetical protein
VSDFVSRVAARAVGQAAVAQPRLPALAAPEPEVDPSGEDRPGTVLAPQTESASRAFFATIEQSRRPEYPPAPREADADPADIAPQNEIELGTRVPAASGPPSDRRPGNLAEVRRPRQARLAAPVVTAAVARPLELAASNSAVPPRSVVDRFEPEAPAVRVHIGRLEVRANLEPEQQTERLEPPSAPRQQETTLSEYLRGRGRIT